MAKMDKGLLGARVGRSNTSVTHLFFADNSILFGEVSTEGANVIRGEIKECEEISGQKANFEKSLIYFSGNEEKEIQEYLIEDRIGWRIGNGKSVTIWNDVWLLGAGDGRIQCQQFDIRYSIVSNLIERDFVTWKQEENRLLFRDEQMQKIVSILLASSAPQEVITWRGDNTGDYTAKTGYSWLNTAEDPTTAKAKACLQAITMAKEMGFREICVEGDALMVIRKLTLATEDRSSIKSIIHVIKEKSYRFSSIQFQYVQKEANTVAHEIAIEGKKFDGPQYWIEEVPCAVQDLVNRERISTNGG
ncbi:hypothetical protein PVK06_010030 [Gossypium arboreum]|uniref:RNase H type-1 domain-containing protein n=1 Tax=Gossypium arboreum TaxID=29729 RepID=A0ABR0QP84_GOSAR|nr:hypothetical protein PVK06_010030 [Gossypium arboreum]